MKKMKNVSFFKAVFVVTLLESEAVIPSDMTI